MAFISQLTDFFSDWPWLQKALHVLILLLVGWILSKVARTVVHRVFKNQWISEKLSFLKDKKTRASLGESLGTIVAALVYLFFVIEVLSVLGLNRLLEPLQDLSQSFIGYIPQLFGAVVILALGIFLANLLQKIVSNLLNTLGLDKLINKYKLGSFLGDEGLSSIIGLIVKLVVLIPVLTAFLEALNLNAVTEPVSQMLSSILGIIPQLVGATFIIALAYFIGKMLSQIVSTLLSGVGFNNLWKHLGFKTQNESASEWAGTLLHWALLFFASIEALNMLHMGAMAEMVSSLTFFLGNVFFGLVIFAAGFFISNLAVNAIRASNVAQSSFLANLARVIVLTLTGSMALRQMDVGDDIITLTLGLTLGSFAVAFAVAFGLGGRDVAADLWKKMAASFKK